MSIVRLSRASRMRCLFRRYQPYSTEHGGTSDDGNKPKDQATELTTNKTMTGHEPAETAAERLNRLLANMKADDGVTIGERVSMAKPGEGHRKMREQAKQASAEKDIYKTVQSVASLIDDGSHKETEIELLSRLLSHNRGERTSDKTAADEQKPQQNINEMSLSELIAGMKIDREKQPKEENLTRAEFIRHAYASKTPFKEYAKRSHFNRERGHQKPRDSSHQQHGHHVNLFGQESLGIFKRSSGLADSADMLATWSHLHDRELKLQISHPPANYFEKMALWTQQGKLWRFPIDNEQDIDKAERNESFSDHIFLEEHIEAWCPQKGPLRHFMELVCVGLSKNPYITAKDKKEHILWYRDYFQAKIKAKALSADTIQQLTGGGGAGGGKNQSLIN